MTNSSFQGAPGAGGHRVFSALLLALLVAASMPASSADSWQGQYQSLSRGEKVTLRFTLPEGSELGELRFAPPVGCSLGVQPSGAAQGSGASYVAKHWTTMPGPYCANFLDASVQTKALDDGRRLRMTISADDSKIELFLYPLASKK